MSQVIIVDGLYLVILVALSIPLGNYLVKVMTGQRAFLSPLMLPLERMIYRLMGIREEDEMSPGHYALAVMVFSGLGLIFVFGLQMLQASLPFNPENLAAPSWDLAFNTAASFVSNTNWQAYSGESSLSYLTQALALGVWNFLSAATGIAVLFALIRGFIGTKKRRLGVFG